MNSVSQGPRPTPGSSASCFADGVMARVAQEPRPTPARVFVRSVLRFRLRDAWAALSTAARLALGPAGPIPTLVRVQSLLLLLVFTVLVSSGGALATAGAIRAIESQSRSPRVEQRLVVPPAGSSASPRWSPGPTVSPSPVQRREQAGKTRSNRSGETPAARRQDGVGGAQPPDREGRQPSGERPNEPKRSGGAPKEQVDRNSRDSSGSVDEAGDGRKGLAPRTPEPAANQGAGRALGRGTGADRSS